MTKKVMPYFERKRIETGIEQADIDKAYARAKIVLEADRIDPAKFHGYDHKEIARHQEYVAKRKAQFAMEDAPEKAEQKKIATIFEAIIDEQTELSDWLGPDVSTIGASEYDDIAHGVDTILQFQHGEGNARHLGMAIDVTFSSEIQYKLNRIKEDIKHGHLTEITYFALPDPENPDEYIAMNKLTVPRVVIGVNRKSADLLRELWMEKKKKDLAVHPVQYIIGREILDQLTLFERYARSCNRPYIAAVYKNTKESLQKSLIAKGDGVWGKKRNYQKETEAMSDLSNDSVLSAIEDYLSNVEAREIQHIDAA